MDSIIKVEAPARTEHDVQILEVVCEAIFRVMDSGQEQKTIRTAIKAIRSITSLLGLVDNRTIAINNCTLTNNPGSETPTKDDAEEPAEEPTDDEPEWPEQADTPSEPT